VTKPRASGEAAPNGEAGGSARPDISTPLKPPPPYCSERPFHSTGRLTWNRIGGAFGSVGSMRPMTLQNSGSAGVTRAAGVGPRSATASGEGACIAAESILTEFSAGPASPLQVAAASPFILAAAASVEHRDAATSEASTAQARASIDSPCIVSSRVSLVSANVPAMPAWQAHCGRQGE